VSANPDRSSARSKDSKSGTQATYERLRADLLACRLEPGERLSIADLTKAYGVSLGAVREALSRLTAEGLVELEPQKGFRATPISAAELRDLTEARIAIEALCIRRAFEVGGLEWETLVVGAFHQMSRTPRRRASDGLLNPDFRAAHRRFHEAVASACDNAWFLRLRGLLYAQAERYRVLSLGFEKTERDALREHKRILDAVMTGDVERALIAMSQHIQKTTETVLAGLDGLEPRPRPEAAARRRRQRPVPADT